jgi:PPOX class probable F420-dependent enzyme
MPKKTTATKKATKKKTKAAKAAVSIPGPRADRPVAKGYGLKDPKDGLLPWSWAEEQLAKSRTYWISTARSDGRPHTMPVWGAWVEGAFWFGTGEGTQKARNLQRNPYCTICTDDAENAVILEGIAKITPAGGAVYQRVMKAYRQKYKTEVPEDSPVFRVAPRRVFGLIEKSFPKSATRWRFE